MKYYIWLILTVIGYAAQAQQEVQLCPGNRTNFTYWTNSNTSTGGWVWLVNNDTVSLTSSANITWNDTGYFTIKVLYNTNCGKDYKLYKVHVFNCKPSTIFFPNAFTPNGDGINDSWSPIPFNISEMGWQVYNRWGEKVYETNRIGDKWNGLYRGTAQPISNFVFICWWKDYEGKKGFDKGNLILIR